MAWTYSFTDLDTTTASGRLNSIRLLIGDTDTTDQQVQDEEITFAYGQTGNVYAAAVFLCSIIASKYARLVDTQLDGALEAKYSDRIKHYTQLARTIEAMAKKASGKSLGLSAGGIPNTPAFTPGMFKENSYEVQSLYP